MLLRRSGPASGTAFWRAPVAPARVGQQAVARLAVARALVVMRGLDQLLQMGSDALVVLLEDLVVVVVPVDGRAGGRAGRQAGREAGRQAVGKAGRQTVGEALRQTDK